MPEQRQIAFAIGPVSVPEQTFDERTFFTWNSFGPRAGITYDLAGDGKTVIKASYGLFWHNPGPGVSADANPNQNNKSVTYTWNDRNGDRRFQLGEAGRRSTATTLAGTVQLDPNITQPYSHDVIGRISSASSAAALGARVGLRLQDRRRSDRAVQPRPADRGVYGAVHRSSTSVPTGAPAPATTRR